MSFFHRLVELFSQTAELTKTKTTMRPKRKLKLKRMPIDVVYEL